MLTSLGQLEEPKVNPRNSNYLDMADDVCFFFRLPIEVVKGGRICEKSDTYKTSCGCRFVWIKLLCYSDYPIIDKMKVQ